MISVGTLSFGPVLEHEKEMAPVVFEALKAHPDVSEIGVSPIDPTLSDTAAFCAAYGVTAEESANCVVLKTKKGEVRGFAAVVILASTRADINGKACEALDVKKASFAPMEEATAASQMEFGAITPVGLPHDWPILIDAKVAQAALVIVGSGVRGSKIALPGKVLASLPGVQVIENLATPKEATVASH